MILSVKSFDTIFVSIQNDGYLIYHMIRLPQTLSSEISSLNDKSLVLSLPYKNSETNS